MRQSRDLYREVGDGAGEARALIWLAFNRLGIADDDEIGDVLAAAIDVARRAERPLETAIALGLSGTWWSLRDLRRAHELVEEGGLLMERAGNPNWLAHSYEFRALVAYLQRDYERARDLLASALPMYLQISNRVCGAHCLETTAALAAATGRPDIGAELLGAAERMREQLGTAAPPYERIVRERGVADITRALDDGAAATAWTRGRELAFEDAMARAREVTGPPRRSQRRRGARRAAGGKDVELASGVAQVHLDRLDRDEQRLRDLGVGRAAGGVFGDATLARGQRGDAGLRVPANPQACGGQLLARTLSQRVRPARGGNVEPRRNGSRASARSPRRRSAAP